MSSPAPETMASASLMRCKVSSKYKAPDYKEVEIICPGGSGVIFNVELFHRRHPQARYEDPPTSSWWGRPTNVLALVPYVGKTNTPRHKAFIEDFEDTHNYLNGQRPCKWEKSYPETRLGLETAFSGFSCGMQDDGDLARILRDSHRLAMMNKKITMYGDEPYRLGGKKWT